MKNPDKSAKKRLAAALCTAEMILVAVTTAACGGNGGVAQQPAPAQTETAQAASGTYIDENSAKASALNHAGCAEADISRFKCEFDIDDGIAEYEIEFFKDGREYEYKINATDGSVMEYEVD